MYKGVVQLSPGNWAYSISIDGSERQIDGEPSARSAADCYDAAMRARGSRVVNTVLYRGEVQAVAGEDDEVTLKRCSEARAAARPARPPKPAPPPPLYKGVQQTGPTEFAVAAYVCLTRKRLGVYTTAEQAARVYDTEMRRQGILAVNFPRLGSREYKVAPDAEDAASPPASPAATAPQPDEMAAAAQVAAPLLARLRQEDAREQQLPRAPPPAPVLAPAAAAAAAVPSSDEDDNAAAPVDDEEASDDEDAALADVSAGSGPSRQRRPSGFYSALVTSPSYRPASTRCDSCKTQKKGVCGTATASLLCLKRTPDMKPPSQARAEAKPARVPAALRDVAATATVSPGPPATAAAADADPPAAKKQQQQKKNLHKTGSGAAAGGTGDARIGASLPSPGAVDAPFVAAAPPPPPPTAAAAQRTHPLPAPDTDPPEAMLPPFSLKVKLHRSPPKPPVPDASALPEPAPASGTARAALFKGIDCRGGIFRLVKIGAHDMTPGPCRTFPTAQAAADAYDAIMREQGCTVVNTPLFEGEIQAVRGELASQTMRRAAEEAEQEQQKRQKRHKTGAAAAGGAGGDAGNARIDATPPSKKPPVLPPAPFPSPPGVDAPVVAAAPQMPPLPALQSGPPVAPPCDLILPASMAAAAAAKRPAQEAAEGAPPSKRARTAADSAASREASPNGSMSANKACSADAPPAPSAVAPAADLPHAPVPMPLAAPVAPAHDLPAFLRRISPPLFDIHAAVASAEADRSLTVAALRDSLRGPPEQALLLLDLACELLGLQCGCDKLALLQALQGAPPATGAPVLSWRDAADELAAFLRGISSPLVDIEAVMDAAAVSGLTVAALRRAARQGGPHGALCVRLIFTMLRVTRGGDKMTLQRALMSA